MTDRKQQRELLGYLLGALDESERDAINRQLATDAALRKRLAKAEASLEILRAVPRVHRPPAGLAARTCRKVFAYSGALASAAANGSLLSRPVRQRARRMSPAAVPPSSVSTWGWSDLVTAAAVFLVVSCSIFPALLHNRANTRLVACQDNLRQLGMSQAQFHQFHGPTLPGPRVDGQAAVGGLPVSLFLSQAGAGDPATGTLSSFAGPAQAATELPAVPRSSVFGHQGFTQTVEGQNALFLDGRVAFLAVAPLVHPIGDNVDRGDPQLSSLPVDPVLPAGDASALAPLAPVSLNP